MKSLKLLQSICNIFFLPDKLRFINKTLILACFISLFHHYYSNAQELNPAESTNGRFGYISADKAGFAIEPIYELAFPFEGKFAVVKNTSGVTLINKKGKVVSGYYQAIGWSNKATEDDFFKMGYTGFLKENKWGLLDQKGREILPAKYDYLSFLSAEKFKVGNRSEGTGELLFGVIDLSGREVIPPVWKELYLESGMMLIRVGSQNPGEVPLYGLIDLDGVDVLLPDFTSLLDLGSNCLGAEDANGNWGLYDKRGKQLLPHKYESISLFENGKAIVKRFKKSGLINTNGNFLLPPDFYSIEKDSSGILVTPFTEFILADRLGNKLDTFYYDYIENIGKEIYKTIHYNQIGLLNAKGEVFAFGVYDSIGIFEEGLALVKKQGLIGALDERGNTIIPCTYRQILREESGNYRAILPSGEYRFYLPNGQFINHTYNKVGAYKEGFYTVEKNNLYGFADSLLQEIIPVKYKAVSNFKGGFASVALSNQPFQGIIDKRGNWVIRPVIDSILVLNQYTFVYKDNQVWGTLGTEGKEWHLGLNESFEVGADGLVYTEWKGKKGLVNPLGIEVVPPICEEILDYSPEEGIVQLQLGGNLLFMDIFQDELPNTKAYHLFDAIGQPAAGLIPYKKDGRFGFIDYMGRIRIINRYDSVGSFSEGMAPFKLNGKWGFINALDQIVIQPHFQSVSSFDKGYAVVRNETGTGVINLEGKFVIKSVYDEVKKNQFGNWMVSKDENLGIYEPGMVNGIYPKYQDIEDLGNGYLIVKKKGKFGLDEFMGFTVIFPDHEKIIYNKYDDTYFLANPKKPFYFNEY